MTQSEEVNLFSIIEERRRESKEEHQLLHERISNMKDELIKEMKDFNQKQIEINDSIDERLTTLERYMWMFVGGGSVAMFFLLGIKDYIFSFLG